MKQKTSHWIVSNMRSKAGPRIRLALASCLALWTAAACADEGDWHRATHYIQSNLVSDQPGVGAIQDTNLVNAWGISFSSTSPFWVSANGTGLSTLYSVTNDASGMAWVSKLGLQVRIPGEGNVTGQVFNNVGGFHSNSFLFASEDGTISGWRQALGTSAEVLAVRTNAVYKGLTLAATKGGPRLLAANFAEGTLDAYDTNAVLVTQYKDMHAPAAYGPFNVQTLNQMVFVAFAKRSPDGPDDVPGPGHGLVDVFDPNTGKFHRLVTGSDAGGRFHAIDSPWGLAVAPAGFGKHSDQLLVGNFGSGTIMTFDDHGRFRGFLNSTHHKPIVIDGLWGLAFGNGGRAGVPGTLYFTAGPDGEGHGLLGSLNPVAMGGDDDDDYDRD